MPLSDFLRDEIIKHLHRTGSWTKPTTLAVCLCSQAVVSGDTGSLTGKELANSLGYARQALNPLDANWAAPGGGHTTSNSSIIAFTPSGEWAAATYIAITDSTTYGAGNLLWFAPLQSPQIGSTSDPLEFAVGDLMFGPV